MADYSLHDDDQHFLGVGRRLPLGQVMPLNLNIQQLPELHVGQHFVRVTNVSKFDVQLMINGKTRRHLTQGKRLYLEDDIALEVVRFEHRPEWYMLFHADESVEVHFADSDRCRQRCQLK